MFLTIIFVANVHFVWKPLIWLVPFDGSDPFEKCIEIISQPRHRLIIKCFRHYWFQSMGMGSSFKVWEWVVSSKYGNGSFREQWNIEISIKNAKLAINNKQSAIFQFYEFESMLWKNHWMSFWSFVCVSIW